MEARKEVIYSVGARIPIIQVSTTEPLRVADELKFKLQEAYEIGVIVEQDGDVPFELLDRLIGRGETVLITYTLQHYLNSPEMIQKLLKLIDLNRSAEEIRTLIVVGEAEFPTALERAVRKIDYPLPSEKELAEKLEDFCKVNGVNFSQEEKEKIVKLAKGLTVLEFQNALGIALVKTTGLKSDEVIKELKNQKEQLIRKNPVLELHHAEDLDQIKGLKNARKFIKNAITSGLGKGVLLLGIPGTGKTLLAKTVGKELNLPIVIMNFEGVFSKYVGESEQKVREALKTVEAVAPCILVVDEIEKALSHGSGDSGVSTRVFGTFLKWLNDRKEGVYVIATANDVSSLPAEFLRAERWDTIFWVDTPNRETLKELLDYYSTKYELLPEQVDLTPDDLEGYTGAEVKSLCRIARIMDDRLSRVKDFVKPVSKTYPEKLERARNFAKRVCIPAEGEWRVEREKPKKGIRKPQVV